MNTPKEILSHLLLAGLFTVGTARSETFAQEDKMSRELEKAV